MATNDVKFYIDVLKSDECQCEKPKKPHMALCYHCFYRLPQFLKRDLYRPIRSGFESAYDSAVQFLNE
jgi:hypothetical protein